MPKGLGHWYIEIEKQGFWRGKVHTWVNRYIMSGSDPSGPNAGAVITAIKGIEDKLHANTLAGFGVGFVQGRAYLSTGGPPFTVANYNVSLAAATATGFGGATWTGKTQAAANTLEVCAPLVTRLNGLSSTGKPIYLRKYYRGVMYGNAEDYNAPGIPAADMAGIAAAAAPFSTGIGTNSWVVIGQSGAQAASPPASGAFIVNRQVPKGKKKKSSSGGSNVLGTLLDGVQAAGAGEQLGEILGAALLA